MQDRVADIEDIFDSKVKQQALFVVRQSHTAGEAHTAHFLRGVSLTFLV